MKNQPIRPITGIESAADIIGGKRAYIQTAKDLHAPGQMWRMMDPSRMIEIFDYALVRFKLSRELQDEIRKAIAHLKKQQK
jgi:AmiR/NasT family two-component response regulator